MHKHYYQACSLLVQVFFVSWDPESIILYSVMTWALFGSLNCLLILRLYMQYYYLRHRRANFTPFDVFSYKPRSKSSAYAMVTMLFGRSLWSENWVCVIYLFGLYLDAVKAELI